MFIAAPFTRAKLWKQPRCSTIDEWIKKMWYFYTVNFIQPQRMKLCCLQVNEWN
jgi:hypothetical protein